MSVDTSYPKVKVLPGIQCEYRVPRKSALGPANTQCLNRVSYKCELKKYCCVHVKVVREKENRPSPVKKEKVIKVKVPKKVKVPTQEKVPKEILYGEHDGKTCRHIFTARNRKGVRCSRGISYDSSYFCCTHKNLVQNKIIDFVPDNVKIIGNQCLKRCHNVVEIEDNYLSEDEDNDNNNDDSEDGDNEEEEDN
jgi:glutamate racemase